MSEIKTQENTTATTTITATTSTTTTTATTPILPYKISNNYGCEFELYSPVKTTNWITEHDAAIASFHSWVKNK